MPKWKRVDSKVVYDSFITLYEDRIIDPNGNEGVRNRIRIKKGSVVVIPRDVNGNYYLVGQCRYAVNEYSWEFPNGGVEIGEDYATAAERELGEETGLSASEMVNLGRFHPVNSLMDRDVQVYFADRVTPAGNRVWQADEYEKIKLKMHTMVEIESMIRNNEISDGFTLCAFLKFVLWLKKGLL